MELAADAVLPFDREQVYLTYRDRLAELTTYLPNILAIEVRERRELDNGQLELVNEWVGGGEIPKVARKFLRPSMLRWTDYATWHDSSYRVSWRTVAHAFPDAIASSGENRFVAVDEGTRLEIRGQIVCDGTRLPAVPRLLASRVGRAVEGVLVGRVAVNLRQVAEGVERLLRAESEAAKGR